MLNPDILVLPGRPFFLIIFINLAYSAVAALKYFYYSSFCDIHDNVDNCASQIVPHYNNVETKVITVCTHYCSKDSNSTH